MDEIRIDNLEVYAYHGVMEKEQEEGQSFFVNAVIGLSLSRPGVSDALEDSVNYAEVCHTMKEELSKKKHQLIETAAYETIKAILLKYSRIETIELELRKPYAPIGLPFESVSVKMKRGWHKICLSVGSNIGDKKAYLQQAIDAIDNSCFFKNVIVSSFSETTPYGMVEQDTFINAAICAETIYEPYELLQFLNDLEEKAGRERKIHWGPRTLDLDIIFYDDYVCSDNKLTIPHIDMENRLFVLEPLNEICSYYRHPVLKKTVSQLLRELQKKL